MILKLILPLVFSVFVSTTFANLFNCEIVGAGNDRQLQVTLSSLSEMSYDRYRMDYEYEIVSGPVEKVDFPKTLNSEESTKVTVNLNSLRSLKVYYANKKTFATSFLIVDCYGDDKVTINICEDDVCSMVEKFIGEKPELFAKLINLLPEKNKIPEKNKKFFLNSHRDERS